MSKFDPLWSPVQVGSIELSNRVALAPMTRISATEDGKATERMAAYYRAFARGGFGLLITRGNLSRFRLQPGIPVPAGPRDRGAGSVVGQGG